MGTPLVSYLDFPSSVDFGGNILDDEHVDPFLEAISKVGEKKLAATLFFHEHVVTIHAIEEDNRPPFIVMEFVDGQSLQEKIDRCGALDVKETLRIGMQIARGLTAAHEQGLVHRDIKPANILLENGVERVKLTDFGIAKATQQKLTERTSVVMISFAVSMAAPSIHFAGFN